LGTVRNHIQDLAKDRKSFQSHAPLKPNLHPQWHSLKFEEIIKLDGSTAFLNIDSQNSLLSEKGSGSAEGIWKRARARGGSLENTLRLVEACRKRGMPCFWFRYERFRRDSAKFPATVLDTVQWAYWRSAYEDERSVGWDMGFVDEVKGQVRDEDIEMVYPGHGSIFASTNLQKHFNAKGIRTLLITGYHTDWCVEMAARDAREFGYIPIVIGDACGTASEEAHESALERINAGFAPVLSTEFIINFLVHAGKRRP